MKKRIKKELFGILDETKIINFIKNPLTTNLMILIVGKSINEMVTIRLIVFSSLIVYNQ